MQKFKNKIVKFWGVWGSYVFDFEIFGGSRRVVLGFILFFFWRFWDFLGF